MKLSDALKAIKSVTLEEVEAELKEAEAELKAKKSEARQMIQNVVMEEYKRVKLLRHLKKERTKEDNKLKRKGKRNGG